MNIYTYIYIYYTHCILYPCYTHTIHTIIQSYYNMLAILIITIIMIQTTTTTTTTTTNNNTYTTATTDNEHNNDQVMEFNNDDTNYAGPSASRGKAPPFQAGRVAGPPEAITDHYYY